VRIKHNMGLLDRFRRNKDKGKVVAGVTSRPIRKGINFATAAGIPDITQDTNSFRDDSNFDNVYDLYDAMFKLDPELNGAVRAVSLTANNYTIDYKRAKNGTIRNAVKEFVDNIDFDDVLINSMRNLMVYGNDINKLVGSTGRGITDMQSLPVKQMTIVDDRGGLGSTFTADSYNPIIDPVTYILREGKPYQLDIPAGEIMHMKIDYRSNWFEDYKGRMTYGIWGASRFAALKQAIRAKYNTMNNRIALEDSMTKQFITISKDAIEGIQDPDEQKDRLTHIMDEVTDLFEALRGDQIPVLPHFVELHHVDLENTIPDSSNFLDSINGDIAAVLHVPRVAAGQERGSTFAATYNANLWAVQAIKRLHHVVAESVMKLFSKHLELMGIPHRKSDLPTLEFASIDEESPLATMQRVTMGYQSGVLTLNQALDILNLPPIREGNNRNNSQGIRQFGELPRENSQDTRKPKGGGNDE